MSMRTSRRCAHSACRAFRPSFSFAMEWRGDGSSARCRGRSSRRPSVSTSADGESIMPFVSRETFPGRGELGVFARKTAIVLAFVAGTALLWAVRHVLILVFIAAVIAAGIAPVVHRVRVIGRHWLGRNVPRGTAVLIVYFPFAILVVLLAAVLVPRLIADT